ncbi:MAG: crossover junction endodeoxyribonuclease RuvC [Ferruginibacter sp.]
MQNKSKIILGIDPGTIVMGYSLLQTNGQTMQLIHMDVLKLSSVEDPYERLQKIHFKVCELISFYKADCFAIEAPFFGKNVQSMLKLGRAQGVAIAAAMQAGIPVNEYSPKKIKMSVTGNGNAAKEQVLNMLQRMLEFTDAPAYMDASDALAVAVCHHLQQNSVHAISPGKSGGWQQFIKKNPGRIK